MSGRHSQRKAEGRLRLPTWLSARSLNYRNRHFGCLTEDENKIQKNQQAEHLKELLKEFGITSQKELDHALAGTLEEMTIGIMTDTITVPANSA